ncbi:NACHT domain-containing protein [Microdochium trichocladiopsis]|uniref:NACHT domain-containing protein n=1 Tax=Microdochium trichocladiopsis TaxID=1682393 RepID=A0A9P8XTB5_9PEZI|nr:NACHT domain-containing protein [Microdochium trichocladiopsis]KAH7012686.1 NACHT domain-containing protein [Microdochium trichocladiopsis]
MPNTVRDVHANNANVQVGDRISIYQTDRCLADLRTTDPRIDKKRIEDTKGGLLYGAYSWILTNDEFLKWRDGESRLLWIKGDPGKGKTMLLCGIIDELYPMTKLNDKDTPALLSYFFCQATDALINNATSVLCGLIFLMVKQQPALISHIREKYDEAGGKLFEGPNAWWTPAEIFENILQDPHLSPSYLIVDALDECIDYLQLVKLIIKRSSISRVKWIVSSRNWPDIEESLDDTEFKLTFLLNLMQCQSL